MDQRVLRVGVIGCGSIVRRHHLACLSDAPDRFVISAYADPSESARQWARNAMPGAHGFADWREMLDAVPLDVALIASPHDQHHVQFMQAVARRLHVFIEKPLAISMPQCREMVASAAAAGVVALVGENERYLPNVRALCQAIESGMIGAVRFARGEMNGILHPQDNAWTRDAHRAGGGILISLGVHRLDALRAAAGPVARVQATATRRAPYTNGAEDGIVVNLQFRNGALGQFSSVTNTHVARISPGLSVVGETGTLVIFQPGRRYSDPPMLITSEQPKGEPLDLPDAILPGKSMFHAEWLHLHDCITRGIEPITNARSYAQTMAIIFAAYQSAETGGWVDVEEI